MLSDERPKCHCPLPQTPDSLPVRIDYIKLQNELTGLWFVETKQHPAFYPDGEFSHNEPEDIWSSNEEHAKVWHSDCIDSNFRFDSHGLIALKKLAKEAGYLNGMISSMYANFIPCVRKQVYVKLIW